MGSTGCRVCRVNVHMGAKIERAARAGNVTLFGVKYTGSLTRRLFSSETVCSPGQRLKSARLSLAASFFL